MSIRLMSWSVLVAGAILVGSACTPTAAASESSNDPQEKAVFCGGFAGIPCAEGYVCVDDPSDDCDPNQGGADCGGICQKEPKKECNNPDRTYVSRDPARCAAIRFICDPGLAPFFDDCGCGCEPAP